MLTGFGVLPQPIPTPLEKRRPAGTINLDFDTPLNSFGFTIVDVEGPEEFETNTGFFIDFLSDGEDVASFDFASFVTNDESGVFDPSIEFGNRSANQIAPITAAQLGVDSFDRGPDLARRLGRHRPGDGAGHPHAVRRPRRPGPPGCRCPPPPDPRRPGLIA